MLTGGFVGTNYRNSRSKWAGASVTHCRLLRNQVVLQDPMSQSYNVQTKLPPLQFIPLKSPNLKIVSLEGSNGSTIIIFFPFNATSWNIDSIKGRAKYMVLL